MENRLLIASVWSPHWVLLLVHTVASVAPPETVRQLGQKYKAMQKKYRRDEPTPVSPASLLLVQKVSQGTHGHEQVLPDVLMQMTAVVL